MIYADAVYTIHPISYILYLSTEPQAPCLAYMSGSFICGFVVLMEPFPLGSGFLLLGGSIIQDE